MLNCLLTRLLVYHSARIILTAITGLSFVLGVPLNTSQIPPCLNAVRVYSHLLSSSLIGGRAKNVSKDVPLLCFLEVAVGPLLLLVAFLGACGRRLV